jgi:hypothetical protein
MLAMPMGVTNGQLRRTRRARRPTHEKHKVKQPLESHGEPRVSATYIVVPTPCPWIAS